MTPTGTFTPQESAILAAIAAGVVVVDRDGVVLFANPQAHAILGQKTLVGKNPGLPIRDGQPAEMQVVREGGTGWVEIRVASLPRPGQTTYVLALTDITDRKAREAALPASKQRFEALLGAFPIGMFQTGADGRCEYVNAEWQKISGMSEAQAVGDGWAQGIHPDDRNMVVEEWNQAVSEQRPFHLEYRFQPEAGRMVWVYGQAVALKNDQGRVTGYVGTITDISEYKAATERIRRLAHYDALTGLPNRVLLEDRVTVALGAAQRRQQHVAVMFLDLDRFKNVNDTLGHAVGDRLLIQAANRMNSQLREEDTLSRLGGDEFILVLPDTDAQAAAHVAGKLLAVLARPYQIDQHELALTASIGIALYPDNGADLAALSRAADTALYRAKHAGRNSYQFFTEEMHRKARRVLEIENALRHALRNNELLLHYQPQIDIANSRLVGLEALARWQHPQWGLVPPAEFIPIAEDSGQIIDIGAWIMRTAIQQTRAWQQAGLPIVPVTVNLALAQFRQTTLCDNIALLLQEAGLEPRYLELELSENIATEDIAFTLAAAERLHALGVGFAIDDFGIGQSSLASLKRYQVRRLKIDQSFVRDMTSDPDDAAIVTAIIHMAKALDFKTIAEGVETVEQLAYLRERNCDEVQGYYFSRPLPADKIGAMLRQAACR